MVNVHLKLINDNIILLTLEARQVCVIWHLKKNCSNELMRHPNN